MLDQRRGRWADVVQMLYKCFVFAGIRSSVSLNTYYTLRLGSSDGGTVDYESHIY